MEHVTTTAAQDRPGDLGRRVTARRRALDLDRSEVARRAELSPAYVEYLETAPAVVTAGVLLRLADALETTTDELLGAAPLVAAASGATAERPHLDVLSRDECERLLGDGGVGRLVVVEERGPVALPVNFTVVDGDVLVRTEPDSVVASVDGQLVGFQVDHIDEALRRGWSVLLSGRARVVTDAGELAALAGALPNPWAAGNRSAVLRLCVTSMSGRRIGTRD